MAFPASGRANEALVVFGTAIRPKLVQRLNTALELARRRPRASIIVSGGPTLSSVPEGRVMARWLRQRGIQPGRMAVEARARHTGENADFVVPLLKKLGATRVTVVTSRQHTRRAGFHMRAALRAAGLSRVRVAAHGAPDGLRGIGRLRAWWSESFKIARDAGLRLKGRLDRRQPR